MPRANMARTLRWLVVTLFAAIVAAGCATPDESGMPDDLSTDNNRDGVPDDPAIDDSPLDGGSSNATDNSTTPMTPGGNLTASS